MNRARLIVQVLLIVILVISPMVAVAQDEGAEETDCGFLGIQCGFIPDILSLIRDLIQGLVDFLVSAINVGLDLVRGLVDFIVTAIRDILQLIFNIFRPIFDFLAAVLRAVIEVIQIIVLLLTIVFGFFIAVVSFAFQAIGVAISMFTTYTTAPVTAIPGLPQCVTDPTSYEICALYYMADWTLFAPGTPGALIVPLLVILLDVTIVFFFVRRVLNLVSIGEKTTDV